MKTKRPNHRPIKDLIINNKDIDTSDTLKSISEVANLLKVHPNTIHRGIKRGNIKAIKMGGNSSKHSGKYFIDITQFIKGGTI